MEFKAGDRVRVRGWEDMEKQFGVDNDGDIKANGCLTTRMRFLCGKEFEVERVSDGRFVEGLDTSYNISTDMLEIAGHSDKRVIIEYGKGKPTVATLLVGGNVVKTATAKCNPDDEYDEQVGVNLAVERLFEKPKKVFSLEHWLSDINPESEISRRVNAEALLLGWPQKCEGKTPEECEEMGYSCLIKDWFVER